ncbi:MAG: hypothetical protein ACM3NJ_00800, partial [Methanobacterium sp.]
MDQRQKVIVLAEPMWTKGHYETQMQLFLSILLPRKCRVIILCAEPDRIMEWLDNNMPEYQDAAFAAYFSVRERTEKTHYQSGQVWQYLADTVKNAEMVSGWKVDQVFITYLDVFINSSWRTLGVRVRFNYPWAGLYFLPSFVRQKSSFLKRAYRRINNMIFYRIKNCYGIGILDEGTYNPIKKLLKNRELIVFPDVTDERIPDSIPAEIAGIRARAGGRTIIGLIGLLQKRKGLLTFLQAMQETDPAETYFLLAGSLPLHEYSPEEQVLLQKYLAEPEGDNWHFELNYIEDPVMFNAYFCICDVIYIVYEDFYHSSGIMTKAAVFEKLMIAAKGYCMGERVEK